VGTGRPHKSVPSEGLSSGFFQVFKIHRFVYPDTPPGPRSKETEESLIPALRLKYHTAGPKAVLGAVCLSLSPSVHERGLAGGTPPPVAGSGLYNLRVCSRHSVPVAQHGFWWPLPCFRFKFLIPRRRHFRTRPAGPPAGATGTVTGNHDGDDSMMTRMMMPVCSTQVSNHLELNTRSASERPRRRRGRGRGGRHARAGNLN
jgi:hypothetical protein